MATKTSVNNMTVVHEKSDGIVTFMPDVCKTQIGLAVVPIPYPNIAKSQDTDQGSKTVTVDDKPIMLKDSVFKRSTGDEAGAIGGVSSGCIRGKAEFINYSFDVKVEGKNVPRLGDQMLGNKGSAVNTPPAAEMQPPSMACGQSENRKKDKLEINVVDAEGNPWKDIKYILKKPDTENLTDKLGAGGKIEQDTIEGVGLIKFPEWPYAIVFRKD